MSSQDQNIQTVKKPLGERIRSTREEKGLKQEELAAALGVTTATVNRYENSRRIPDADFLNRMVMYTGCDPGWLLVGRERIDGIVHEDHTCYMTSHDATTEEINRLLVGMGEDRRRGLLEQLRRGEAVAAGEKMMPDDVWNLPEVREAVEALILLPPRKRKIYLGKLLEEVEKQGG